MVYTDIDLRVNNGETVRASSPDYSSSIDLTLSPDIGAGNQLVAIIVVDTYTAGSNSHVDFEVVTSASSTFGTDRVLGTKQLTTAQLEARDDDANKQPIVVRINPDQEGEGGLVNTANERYLGIRYTFSGATPSALTTTAYFVTDYQGDPAHSHHASGMTIA